jgi:CubicO group peptidase (beta-lactamase class C family)
MAAVAIANRQELLVAKAFGSGGVESPELLGRQFALASITKAIAGVGVARLYEQGLVDYEKPIADYVPEFGVDAPRRKITLAHVFTHSTGLPSRFAEACAKGGYSPDVILRQLCQEPLAYPTGTRMAYTTHTYQLVNAVVARILDGASMTEFLTRFVFEPCGMRHTGFFPQRDLMMPVVGHPIPDSGALPAYCAMEMSGSGLWSTLHDLVALGQAWLTPGRLVSSATFEFVTNAQPGLPMVGRESERSRRTLGWVKEGQPRFPRQPESGFYHGGATGTLLWLDPARAMVFVFLSNRWASGNDHAFDVLNSLYE